MLAAALVSCRKAPADGAAEDTSYRLRPGYVIDSVRPIEVDLAQFREKLGPAPSELEGGARSLDDLVARFAHAIEGRDTVALRRMQVNAAEYAWLVYPTSIHTKPPYQQAPQIAWMLLQQASDGGLRRLLDRRGGAPLRLRSNSCDREPLIEGENRFWQRCTILVGSGPDTTRERLFGTVIERNSRFKFTSYQNQY